MFKYLVTLILIGIVSGTLQVYSPQCAVKKFQKPIEYTLSNFGEIPYGQVIIGQIRIPKNELLCSTDGQAYINNKDPTTKVILLVKRGECKFTQKVINAQNIGADLIIIYDNIEGDNPSVIMKNDGHGHLTKIPSMLVSNKDGLKLKTTDKDCKTLPIIKVQFLIEQTATSSVTLWLDAGNRQSYILARDFYKNDYYKILQPHMNMNIRFRIETNCKEDLICKKDDCVGVIKQKYCRNVPKLENPEIPYTPGRQLIYEQLRQYFLWQELKNSKDKILWWKYMTKFDHQICIQKADVADCSYTVMKDIAINSKVIQQVEKSVQETVKNVTESKNSILKLVAYQARELGIYFYPEATINDRNFYGLFKAPQVFQMICDSLLDPPTQCITFIKNNHQVYTNDQSEGLWKTILMALLFMTVGFIVALLVYTKIIRKEVDQQLSVEVNKMVENYVDLASRKNTGNSYSKFDS